MPGLNRTGPLGEGPMTGSKADAIRSGKRGFPKHLNDPLPEEVRD
ncbi:MAG: DUF5320 domain-containing protein [Bacteroidota bacterium]